MRSWIFGQKNQDEVQDQAKTDTNDATNQNEGPQHPAAMPGSGANTG